MISLYKEFVNEIKWNHLLEFNISVALVMKAGDGDLMEDPQVIHYVRVHCTEV